MGEILGLGMTHYPGMTTKSILVARAKSFMKDPLLPDEFKDPATWPEPMRREWSNDEGWAASEEHRRLLTENLRWIRSELDAFNLDVVLIWGDDQYENFRESIVPAFALMAYPEFNVKPWSHLAPGRENSWDEPLDKQFHYKGHQKAGKYLANRLIADGLTSPTATSPTTVRASVTPSRTRRFTWTGTARACPTHCCRSRLTATAGR